MNIVPSRDRPRTSEQAGTIHLAGQVMTCCSTFCSGTTRSCFGLFAFNTGPCTKCTGISPDGRVEGVSAARPDPPSHVSTPECRAGMTSRVQTRGTDECYKTPGTERQSFSCLLSPHHNSLLDHLSPWPPNTRSSSSRASTPTSTLYS
jgi:hypothetical protein